MSVKCKHGKPVYQGCVDCPPDCKHDKKFGLMGLPPKANGCLACHAEQLAANNAELLAACEASEKYINEVRFSASTLEQIEAAIANAQPQGE